MLNYPEFKKALYDRYLDLQDEIVNLYSDNILGENYIDKTVTEYWDSISRNYNEAGWIVGKTYSELERVPDQTYEENVEFFRNWLQKRNDWLLGYWDLKSQITVKPDFSVG